MTAGAPAARSAQLPIELWLASADRARRDDIVIAWDRDPEQAAILPCGIKWDAIATPIRAGLNALRGLLGGQSRHAIGPVLHSHREDRLHWLIPIETVPNHWTPLRALHLGHGHHIAAVAPGRGVTRPAEWIHLPAVAGILTPPHMLAAALRAVADDRNAP